VDHESRFASNNLEKAGSQALKVQASISMSNINSSENTDAHVVTEANLVKEHQVEFEGSHQEEATESTAAKLAKAGSKHASVKNISFKDFPNEDETPRKPMSKTNSTKNVAIKDAPASNNIDAQDIEAATTAPRDSASKEGSKYTSPSRTPFKQSTGQLFEDGYKEEATESTTSKLVKAGSKHASVKNISFKDVPNEDETPRKPMSKTNSAKNLAIKDTPASNNRDAQDTEAATTAPRDSASKEGSSYTSPSRTPFKQSTSQLARDRGPNSVSNSRRNVAETFAKSKSQSVIQSPTKGSVAKLTKSVSSVSQYNEHLENQNVSFYS
jgi:hypothetical protein